MAGIKELAIYRNKVCGGCLYSWDYPTVREDLLSPVQKLYYFEINECPTCRCIGTDITQVGDYEKNIQNDKEYKSIKQTRNIPFSFVSKKEAYEYALFAYICAKRGDYYLMAKAYVMAAYIEGDQRYKYINSLSYNPDKDGELISASEVTQNMYYNRALAALDNCDEQEVNKAQKLLLTAYIYKCLNNSEEVKRVLNLVAKMKLTDLQVATVKELVGVKN